MRKALTHITFALAISLSLTATTVATLEGRVVNIADGDTLTMMVDGQKEKVRLSDIDTPERKQSLGIRAKQRLPSRPSTRPSAY